MNQKNVKKFQNQKLEYNNKIYHDEVRVEVDTNLIQVLQFLGNITKVIFLKNRQMQENEKTLTATAHHTVCSINYLREKYEIHLKS